jgi:hypothetical protein
LPPRSRIWSHALLQYDPQTRRYDLHSVVQATVVGRLGGEELQQLEQRVADHFATRPHPPPVF